MSSLNRRSFLRAGAAASVAAATPVLSMAAAPEDKPAAPKAAVQGVTRALAR
jgi:hypothetical protein